MVWSNVSPSDGWLSPFSSAWPIRRGVLPWVGPLAQHIHWSEFPRLSPPQLLFGTVHWPKYTVHGQWTVHNTLVFFYKKKIKKKGLKRGRANANAQYKQTFNKGLYIYTNVNVNNQAKSLFFFSFFPIFFLFSLTHNINNNSNIYNKIIIIKHLK